MPTWTWKQWHLLFRTMGVWWELPDKARVFDKCEFCSPGGIQWSLTCGNLKFVVTVVQSLNRAWLCDPLNCSTPGFLVLHCLLEFAQTHVHWVSDAWCHPTISSSLVPFSFCPQSLPASGTFPMSHLFTSDEIFFLSLCLFPPEIRDSWVLSSLIRCVVKIISWHMQES